MVMASVASAGVSVGPTGGTEAAGRLRAPHLVQPALLVNSRHHLDCDMIPKKLRLSLCVGCGGQIHDQYILRVAPDLEWHAACLKCQECRQFLDESCTCFVRDGKTYCKRDYTRLFGTKCDKCGASFSKNDFVMRAKTKIYHIDCFRCCACAKQLIPGDEFALREGGALYCKEDHEAGERSTSTAAGRESNNNTSLSNNNHSTGPQELASMSDMAIKEEPCSPVEDSDAEVSRHTESILSDCRAGKKRSRGLPKDSESESGSHKGGARGKGNGSASGGSGGDGKPTRVRTVLNEKQLHTLRTCYNANPRPDALMKEQLVEMTSLSPRVIRVWFQNKRCKDKKKTIQMKLQMQQEKYLAQEGRKLGYGGMQGVALVAGSPVRHDSPLGLAPLEVTAYQPPWKALSDFALHTDLDQGGPPHGPAFQHLVNQMHGYDLGNMHHPPPPLHQPMMQDSLVHPDSADSYVTYLESDDSIPASP